MEAKSHNQFLMDRWITSGKKAVEFLLLPQHLPINTMNDFSIMVFSIGDISTKKQSQSSSIQRNNSPVSLRRKKPLRMLNDSYTRQKSQYASRTRRAIAFGDSSSHTFTLYFQDLVTHVTYCACEILIYRMKGGCYSIEDYESQRLSALIYKFRLCV